MDILNNPVTSRKDFLKLFSSTKADKDFLKEQFKVLKKELGKRKTQVSHLTNML